MVSAFQEKITAEDIKAKARELGADIVGIADSAEMNANPPDPADPRIPANISDYDADRVIVVGKRLSAGVTRIPRWDERHKYYNDELTMKEVGAVLGLTESRVSQLHSQATLRLKSHLRGFAASGGSEEG